MRYWIYSKSGFTLVELLVVVTIIVLLATAGTVSYREYGEHMRDQERIVLMDQIQFAIDLYVRQNGTYPDWKLGLGDPRESSCFTDAEGGPQDGVGEWSSALQVLVAEGYFDTLPEDPMNNGRGSMNGRDYCFAYMREAGNMSTFDACRHKDTLDFYYPADYEYLLYFSVENDDNWPIQMNWRSNDTDGPNPNTPYNACIVGPAR